MLFRSLAASFDLAGPTFRDAIVTDYKANRAAMPDELAEQIAWVHEACEAMGATGWQRLAWVRLPLAAPIILAGVRTAAVITVGAATLAAFIGAGGLGDPIVTGLALAAAAALVNASSARPTVNSAPSPVARRLTAASLLAALVIALAETTWFNWAGTLARGVYSVVIGGITLRRW